MAADTGAMFTSGQEEQAIRDAVRGIVDSFGPDYYSNRSTMVRIARNSGMRWAPRLPGCASAREVRWRGTGAARAGDCRSGNRSWWVSATGDAVLGRSHRNHSESHASDEQSPGGWRAWPSAKHVCRSRLPSPMPARMPLGQTSSRHDHLFGRRPSRRRQSCISSSRSTAPERRALRGE